MEITLREPLPIPSLPLPLGEMVTLADVTSSDGDSFTITLGLDEALIAEFKKRSCDTTDTELMTQTADYKRMCEGSYETWYAKERYPFALRHESGVLAGLIWFGPREFLTLAEGTQPTRTDWDTFAIRLYAPFRGKHLATGFAQFALSMHHELRKGRGVCLDTYEEMVGAVALYKKLGFKKVGYTGGEHRKMVMIRE